MVQKYPISIQDFEKLRKGDFLYVDKTNYIHQMIDIGGYYFLSRPRRFGKSLFISTLECVFQAKKDLFEDTFIYDKWDWSTEYPVIRISFSEIGHREYGLESAIRKRLTEIASHYELEIETTKISQIFRALIKKLHAKFNQRVVVLIDEYDKPIIDFIGDDLEKAIRNREVMKIFYSILKDADPHLKLVFITGISKFSRVSIFSDLNNLFDITTNQYYAGICGITHKELDTHFSKELELFDIAEIQKWYDGYSWDMKTKLYNPFSILNFFAAGKFQNFWFHTGTPSFLIEIAKREKLYDFEGVISSVNGLEAFNIENLDLIPLLYQTGYLTTKKYDERKRLFTLGYPNEEVKQSYLESLSNAYVPNAKDKAIVIASELETALATLQLTKLKR